MMRFLMPIILIGISVTIFFMFTNPIYNQISLLRTQMSSYNEALGNSKSLENERDKLTAKYNTINPDNLSKLQKLVPDNIDNIRLILEIGQIASPYGMTLKDVKYDNLSTKDTKTTATNTVVGATTPVALDTLGYGIWDLEFSTTGTYNNFISFVKDLESNLRIVDISSVSFSSDLNNNIGLSTNSGPKDIYTYSFKIKTYWLKK